MLLIRAVSYARPRQFLTREKSTFERKLGVDEARPYLYGKVDSSVLLQIKKICNGGGNSKPSHLTGNSFATNP